jgi:hypothetical protein
MKNLKGNFCFAGSVETDLYIKYHAYWNPKMNVLPKFGYANSVILYRQIIDKII